MLSDDPSGHCGQHEQALTYILRVPRGLTEGTQLSCDPTASLYHHPLMANIGMYAKCPRRQASGLSPCSQWTPVLPGGQEQLPVAGSQAAPCPHPHTWAQPGPKWPCGQTAGRKGEGGHSWLDPPASAVSTQRGWDWARAGWVEIPALSAQTRRGHLPLSTPACPGASLSCRLCGGAGPTLQ